MRRAVLALLTVRSISIPALVAMMGAAPLTFVQADSGYARCGEEDGLCALPGLRRQRLGGGLGLDLVPPVGPRSEGIIRYAL